MRTEKEIRKELAGYAEKWSCFMYQLLFIYKRNILEWVLGERDKIEVNID